MGLNGNELSVLFWIVVALLDCAIIVILLLCLRVLRPVRKLKELTRQLDTMDWETLSQEAEKVPGAPGEAARAIAAYIAADENGLLAMDGGSAAEEAYKMKVVDEICSSLLPQVLKETPAGRSYALAGDIQPGRRENCSFYDYFYLDDDRLCLVVGQVPGSGIAEALFAVVAQTAIRSRLRLGRSLIETMSDVNTQLYDLGGRNTVCALVGVVNTVSGQLSYVNAGGTVPFLMRSEERYEWLKTPVYAPLGANESVTYRSEKLRLGQGDRLFLYTADLGEMQNREGEKFLEKEFQSVLNRSRTQTQTREMEELLRFVRDEAAAFCESGSDVLSSAALALEYKRGNKDYVFTLVKSSPENASLVTDFIRRTLEEGGISPKERALHLLLTDELFTLCCRCCPPEEDMKVACAILPEEGTIHLRIFAPMGGEDPLRPGEDGSGGEAANYIRTHTRRVNFEAGIERDMVELVSDLARGEEEAVQSPEPEEETEITGG